MNYDNYLNTELKDIFVAENTIPAFWLMGFSSKDLSKLNQKLIEFTKDYEKEEWIDDNRICWCLDKDVYLTNLIANETYLNVVYPELLTLYRYFQRLVMEHGQESKQIKLILCPLLYKDKTSIVKELSLFYQSIDLLEETGVIRREELFATTTGFDYQGDLYTNYIEPFRMGTVKNLNIFYIGISFLGSLFLISMCLFSFFLSVPYYLATKELLTSLGILFFSITGGVVTYFELKEKLIIIKYKRSLKEHLKLYLWMQKKEK